MGDVEVLKRRVAQFPGLLLEGDAAERFAHGLPDAVHVAADPALDEEGRVFCVWALRKVRRFEDAHRVVDAALAAGRSWPLLTAKASVHRAQEATDAAVALFAEAAQVAPADTAAMTEAGHTLGEVGRFREAADWFGRAVARDPAHTEAAAWHEYAAFLADRDPARVDRVRALAAAAPEGHAAHHLLACLGA